ncbi:transcription regulator hth lysr [Lucifera butyrica]|uniref:Transcription regulator hth lysr n=1 Tax=Lucifera butyrica TaxID=1351585 RepID=A0A498RC92_9FIRM|nr:LysR family transcriptional regulator [Lucifera butyrica]VBB08537.1 transcription regulator hth lysr [Lucifera butyrica]
MDLTQLTYFKAIVEAGSITKAADRVHVPQPYLSNQLKNMEHALGVKLAIRSTRKFQLTDAGRRFFERATQILELMDTTSKELESYEAGLQGTLKVGTISTSAAILLSDSIRKFHEKYPDVKFEIRNMVTQKIQESLKIGTIELGIIRTPFNTDDYDSFNLPKQPMVAIQNTEYESNENIIRLSELSKKPLLVNYRFESIIIDAFHSAGFEPNILCKIDDTRLILLCSNSGMGTAIIPKDWVNILPGLNLYYREITAPTLETSSAVIWAKNHTLSSVARNFLDTFKQ